ncbi:transcriptional repressor TCF25-domain-containing protein [Dactylonectria estremocensis]|uniref:Transcriptional repressor TCF25-domain-containing protein n=1 Tax=Dactylonectria estremocensis TaxID=1079267 RepID=A0A9P9E8W4_9HYPO|nr:transcriptional repressor TCF25-domain-containing protein [Dactylonectria estremocensis]
MSSRQLRKLQKQRELEKTQDLDVQGSDDSEDGLAPVAAKPRVSLFAALGGDEDDTEVREEDDDDEPEPQVVQEVSEPQTLAGGKSKKKKKKKKKARAVQDAAALKDEEEDEIDRAIKELNITTTATKAGAGAQPSINLSEAELEALAAARRINDLLSINPYHLRVVNEMRNLFGRDIIESAAAEEEQEHMRRHQGPVQREVDLETFLRGPPGAKKLPEVSLRRNVFIQGREYWPRQSAGGLAMREVKKTWDGLSTEYAYFHEGDYDAVQVFFFGCVQIGEPMRMVHLLKQVPYHVSTLLQVSSIAKQDQNMALAAELCERALWTFGRVTTSAFRQNMERGQTRLDFRRPENRQFWLAGYHYLKSLIRKGTYRTALEWAKLLYMLDPQDPYAMRHFIHPLAIRAREAGWFIDFVEEAKKTQWRDSDYLQQSLVLAKLQMGDIEGARAEMSAGMKQVPWLYCTLFQELNLDSPPSIWGINADSDGRSFWTKLYIHQAKDLWNNAQATGLLLSVANSLSKVDMSQLASRDAPPDLGSTRLAYLEGQTSLLTVAPREFLDSQPNYEFDPLPPPVDENIFTGEGTRMPWLEKQQSVTAQASDIEARMRNMLERQAGPAGPLRIPGADPNLGLEEDDDDEGLARLLERDEAELQQDLEGHARGGNGTGLLGALIQLLGGGGARQASGDENVPSPQSQSNNPENLPGAWPEDDDEAEYGGRR